MRRVLGPAHPLTLKASTQHARCMYESGQHSAAEALLVEVRGSFPSLNNRFQTDNDASLSNSYCYHDEMSTWLRGRYLV